MYWKTRLSHRGAWQVAPEGAYYGVKAISSNGKLNDVKGVKMYDKRLETTMYGVEVHAHVVALPQIQ